MLYREITDWEAYKTACAKRLKRGGMSLSEHESTIKECYDLNIGHLDTLILCATKEESKLMKFRQLHGL